MNVLPAQWTGNKTMIYEEKKLSKGIVFLLLSGFFILFYPVWELGGRELTGAEGFFSAAVSGITSLLPDCRIHGELVPGIYPLYPLLVKGLTASGLSMELALRMLSIVSLGGLALFCGIICFRMTGLHGGAAACCAVFSTALACGSGIEGSPKILAALLVLAGYQSYFNGNQARGSWSSAWMLLGLFAGLAFYCDGFRALFYLLIPMIFLPRPFTPYRRMNHGGFVFGVMFLVLFLLCRIVPRWMPDSSSAWIPFPESLHFSGYITEMLYRPFKACLLLVPWVFFLYAPYCPALIEIDRNPLYSKYLRVLFSVGACIYVLNPFSGEEDLFYLVPVFALMIGLHYDIVVRRHGDFLSKLLRCAAAAGILLCTGGILFLLVHKSILLNLGFGENYLRGRESGAESLLLWIIYLGAGILCGISACILACRRKALFLIILMTVCSYMFFFWAVVNPYRCAERSRSRLGETLRDALKEHYCPRMTVYKDSAISGLYPECHYLGTSIRSIPFNSTDFSREKTIFLLTISNIQPRDISRIWTKVVDVIYRNQNLYMWKGTLNDRKERPDEDISNMQF